MKKWVCLVGLLTLPMGLLAGERPPLDKFFEGQRVNSVSISPDGRYLALVMSGDGLHYIATLDRQQKTPPKPIMQLDPKDHSSVNWCTWAKADRLLCSIMFTGNEAPLSRFNAGRGPAKYFASSRIVAIDASGANSKVLVAKKTHYAGQFQDRIIDWLPDDSNNVLIQLNGDVHALNIRNDKLTMVEPWREYVGGYATDGKGNVRLASGVEGTTLRVFAKTLGSKSWKEIIKREVKLEDEAQFLDPEVVIPDTDEAYATGDFQGFSALWRINLTGASEPRVLFAEPNADVHPIFGPDRQLLGAGYESDMPGVKYFNSSAQLLQEVANKLLPGHINQLMDFTRDLKTVIVRSQSDQDPATFYVLDLSVTPPRLERVGSAHPALKGFELAKVEPISFPASDGTTVSGYLTRPSGDIDTSKAPLIVLPHGGPHARDRWGFDSWVQYLASRGYVVLQVEFRGSRGFGSEWLKAGFADWAGKPYSDVVDGTKWALSKKYGDSSRTCIVGASFGGYIALLAATRNPESKLYKCAVSIAGVSDLRELSKDIRWFSGWKVQQQVIGTNTDKLREDSPRTHAKEIDIPVMLIHGDQDFTVEVDESRLMDQALSKAGKPHDLVVIKGADHYFREDAYLKTMFTTMDTFLGKHLVSHRSGLPL